MKRRAVFLKKYKKSKRGMTLVELVVAIAIVAIVFAGTMSALVNAYTSIIYNSSDEKASHIAEGIVDKVSESIKGLTNDDDVIAAAPSLESENDAVYVNNLSRIFNFPDNTVTDDAQFTIRKINNDMDTMAPSGQVTSMEGYEIIAAVRTPRGYVTCSGVIAINGD